MTEESKPEESSFEIALPGISNELRVALLSLHLLENRLSKTLRAGYPAGIDLETYVEDVRAAVTYMFAQLPSPNYDVPVLLSLLRLTIVSLARFGSAVNLKYDTEVERQIGQDQPKKADFPLDPSLRAV